MENAESLIAVNQLPESYYEVKVEGGNIAPFVPPVATEQNDLKNKLEKSQQDFNDYKQTMEARFDKLATMLQALGGSK
jgi:uncharacterized membrane-anchored protein YhcB (DUF1043 family)